MSATTEPAVSPRIVLVARTQSAARQVIRRWAEVLPELAGALPLATTQGDRAWHDIGKVDAVYVAAGADHARVPYRRLLSALKWRLRARPAVLQFLPVDPADPIVRRGAGEVLEELRRAEPVPPEDVTG